MPSYPEEGRDWFGYPPTNPPGWFSLLAQQLFRGIQAELIEQGKWAATTSGPGEGYVVFRQDMPGWVTLDCELNLTKLVERLEKAVRDYEPPIDRGPESD